jgi:uroporphyrinogen III methyltransferase/synthase
VNGVEAFFETLLEADKDIRELAGIQIAAIGPATQKALEDKWLKVAFVPEEYRAEKIAQGLSGSIQKGDRILLARAQEARNVLPDTLKAMGAEVWDVPAYQTVAGQAGQAELKQLLKEKAVDAVTFTSSSTVRNLMQLLDGDPGLLEGVKLVSIGPITSNTARELGLHIDQEAQEYTIDGLVQMLVKGVRE